jgi:cbb3-type cytochrome oxidase subunit 3
MDINLLRSLVTGSAFLLFIAILIWTFWPSRKADFEEAATLPFRSD